MKDKLYEILEDAYKFNRKPRDTYNKIVDVFNQHILSILSRYRLSDDWKGEGKIENNS